MKRSPFQHSFVLGGGESSPFCWTPRICTAKRRQSPNQETSQHPTSSQKPVPGTPQAHDTHKKKKSRRTTHPPLQRKHKQALAIAVKRLPSAEEKINTVRGKQNQPRGESFCPGGHCLFSSRVGRRSKYQYRLEKVHPRGFQYIYMCVLFGGGGIRPIVRALGSHAVDIQYTGRGHIRDIEGVSPILVITILRDMIHDNRQDPQTARGRRSKNKSMRNPRDKPPL